jgi:hypothetical protein
LTTSGDEDDEEEEIKMYSAEAGETTGSES